MDRARCEEMLVDARELQQAARGIRGSPRASPAPARREVPGGSGKLDASSSGSGQRGMSGSLSAAQLALASIFRPAGPPVEVSMALRETEVQAWVDTLVVEPPSVLRSHSAPSGQSGASDGGADRVAHV